MPCFLSDSRSFTGMPSMRSIIITVAVAPVPVDLGNDQQPAVGEVAPQLARVRRLAQQVELVADGLLELRHHLARTQPLAVGMEALHQRADEVEERDVLGDGLLDAGAQDLHRHLAPVGQRGEMHLRHRGAGHRREVDRLEDLRVRPAEGGVERGGDFARAGRAAPGPAAARAPARCPRGSGPGAPRAAGRTSRRSGPGPRSARRSRSPRGRERSRRRRARVKRIRG